MTRKKAESAAKGPKLQPPGGDIAIIGLALRFPGAEDLDGFWQDLAAGRSRIGPVPAERWDRDALYGDPRREDGKTNSIWGGFVENADCFDAAFFGISPREARTMDPQQRFALELSWRAIEDAGIAPGRLAGSRTGVFMGCCHGDYAELFEKTGQVPDAFLPTGIAYSIIANRVSFFFDLTGPSVTLDTACASSLAAVEQAVQALRSGICDTALAGGVNLVWSPDHFIAFAKSGMLSRSGRSRAFDASADGYVRGEGGAVLLLKPLQRAVADGDAIHAVIKAIGSNHGGRTSALTVTNPDAQARLIREVHSAAGIHPATIGYIEAHGTGTPIGDPIEVVGLKKAFADLYREFKDEPRPATCGLGSVKTNIGHLEGAAGVAGIVKVIAAMRHRMLPPNVGFKRPNPMLHLDGSPFFVVDALRPWPDENAAPLRAGVSSFGFGGSNAHAVLESPPAAGTVPADGTRKSVLVPLSARDPGRLRDACRRLVGWLKAQGEPVDLAAVAFTLQTGRDAMAARAAFVADDVDTLCDALTAVAETRPLPENAWVSGQADGSADPVPGEWLGAGQPDRIAARWVAGASAEWHSLYESKPRPLRLPTYPFARERFWFTEPAKPEPGHPLLARPDGSGRAAARLDSAAFYLVDHIVGGRPVLPGVVGLELARVVASWEQPGPVTLTDVVWLAPVEVTGSGRTVDVVREGDAFRIADGNARFCQGRFSAAPAAVPPLDLAALRSACSGQFSVEAGLARLVAAGIAHGPAFRTVEAVHLGEGCAVAELRLGAVELAGAAAWGIHPVLLDGAIQATVALLPPDAAPGVPFAVERVDIFSAAAAPRMVAVLRPVGSLSGATRRFDIDLCGPEGGVRVRLSGLLTRPWAGSVPMTAGNEGETLLLRPEWTDRAVAADAPAPTRLVLLCGLPAALADSVGRALGEVQYRVVGTEAADPGATATGVAATLLPLLRDLVGKSAGRPRLLQMVALQSCDALASGLTGLAGTVALEAAPLRVQVVAVDPAADPMLISGLLAEDARALDDRIIRHHEGRRQVRRLAGISAPAMPTASPWRDGGVYLVTGGLGGLGRIFARDIAVHARRPTVILTGRSKPGEAAQAFLAELERLGARAAYHAADVADVEAVAALVARTRAEHGRISGVLHSAGLIRDALLIRKNMADAASVLAPKVAGAMALDAATANQDLDFFACFASIAGVLGNLGQADYALANGFLDGFAAWRNRLVVKGERRGRTVSVDWPLWADGGMAMPPEAAAQMRKNLGLIAMPTAAGLGAFAAAVGCGESQVVVVHGLRGRMLERLDGGIGEVPAAHVPSPGRQRTAAASVEAILATLLKIVAREQGLDESDLAPDQPLGEFGFDSFGLTMLAERMSEALGIEVPTTALFGQPTLADLARYLAEDGDARTVTPPEPAPPPVRSDDEPIAIIGVSGAFPGADSLDAFWANLVAGRDQISEIPPDRWDWRAIWGDPIDQPGCTNVKWGGFMDGIAEFDPRFFGISPREAELIDPQQRLLITHVWRAIEESGHAPSSLAGSRTAVYLAIATAGYEELAGQRSADITSRTATGTQLSIAPNRISFHLDLHGPSETVDTACSSSLVALHRGVEALRRGGATLAIVGGINLMLTPLEQVSMARAGMLSPTGRSRAFSADADGYARGEGVGIFVLKPLRTAEADGDHIHAVIRATGVNHGGRAHSLTAPNPVAQAELLVDVYRRAGVDPRTVTYVEAHGTGTALGDPVEVEGMTRAFRQLYEDWGAVSPALVHCGLGSAKTHIGHLETAAGAAGLAKVLLQIRHRTQVANLHFTALNPRIQLAGTPFEVVGTNRPWAALKDDSGRELPRRAGVSSFGFGGVNAHAVIEEYLPAAASAGDGEGNRPAALVLSARNDAQLTEACRQLRAWIGARHDGGRDLRLADVAYTLQVGRDAMPVRLGLVAATWSEVEAKLDRHLAGESGIPGLFAGRAQRAGDGDGVPLVDADHPERMVQAWVAGGAVDWRCLHRQGRRRVSLPTYPFVRDRYWLPAADDGDAPAASPAKPPHPLLQRSVGLAAAPRYRTRLSGSEPFLRDHVVGGRPVLPGAAFVEMARAAVHEATDGRHGGCLFDIRFERFAAPGPDGLTLEVALDRRPDDVIAFTIGGDGPEPLIHCRGLSRAEGVDAGDARLDLAAARARMTRGRVSGVECLAAYRNLGLVYGPSHQGLVAIDVGDGEILAEVALPEDSADRSPAWVMNPALLDAALQATIGTAAGPDGRFGAIRAEVPVAIQELTILKALPARLRVLVGAKGTGGMDLTLCAEDGAVCARLLGFRTFPIKQNRPGPAPRSAVAAAPVPATVERLAELLARTIAVEAGDIDPRAGLSDYGLDMVAHIRFAQTVREAFAVELSVAELAATDSLDAIAARLDDAKTGRTTALETYWADLAIWTAKPPAALI